MNKIKTMKRKEILQNLKFVEEIVIRTSAIAEYEVTHPEDYANSIDEMRGVRFGARVISDQDIRGSSVVYTINPIYLEARTIHELSHRKISVYVASELKKQCGDDRRGGHVVPIKLNFEVSSRYITPPELRMVVPLIGSTIKDYFTVYSVNTSYPDGENLNVLINAVVVERPEDPGESPDFEYVMLKKLGDRLRKLNRDLRQVTAFSFIDNITIENSGPKMTFDIVRISDPITEVGTC